MDPDGNFHRLIEEPLAEKPIRQKGQFPLHPDHVRLLLKVSQKPVSPDWPIFTIGERYNVGGRELEVTKITAKDIHLTGVGAILLNRGDIFKLQGRDFRVRFVRLKTAVMRPVLGNVVRS